MRVPAQAQLPEVAKSTRLRGVGEPIKNYGKLPTSYDILIRERKLSGAIQRDVIWIIMRATWGSEKRPEWAALSLSQIAEQCGGVDPTNLSTELLDLAERQIIEVEDRKGCGVKRYKLTPANWRNAKPYEKKDDPRTEAAAAVKANADTLIVRPGSKGTCRPARLMPAGSEPVDFQIAYSNVGSVPVQVSSFVEADIVRITFGDHKAKREQKANPAIVDRREEGKAKTAVGIDLTRQIAFENGSRILLESYFTQPFTPKTNPADQKLFAQILEAAGPDLHPDFFDSYCRAEIDAMRRKRKPIYSGILVPLASQAARKWPLVQADIAAAAPPPQPAPLPPPAPLDLSLPWDRIRQQLQAICSEITYLNWFARTRQISAGKAAIVVAVPDEGTKMLLEDDEPIKQRISEACAYTQQPSKIIWKVEA